MSFSGARKYTSNRKQELQLKRELEGIRNKALVDHYMKDGGQQLDPQSKVDGVPSYPPRPPKQPKPDTLRRRGRSLQQTSAMKTDREVAPQVKQSSRKASQQKPPPQKVVLDTSHTTNKKFAITTSLNTCAPIKYTEREPWKSMADSSSHQADKQAPNRPISQATTGTLHSKASETSYQRYILSHAEYLKMDSNVTSTATNTPVDKTIAVAPGEEEDGDGGGEVEDQSLASFQSEKSHISEASVSSGGGFESQRSEQDDGTERQESSTHSLLESASLPCDSNMELAGISAGEPSVPLLPCDSNVESGGEEAMPSGVASTQVPHSGTLRLSIDMRFDSRENMTPELERVSEQVASSERLHDSSEHVVAEPHDALPDGSLRVVDLPIPSHGLEPVKSEASVDSELSVASSIQNESDQDLGDNESRSKQESEELGDVDTGFTQRADQSREGSEVEGLADAEATLRLDSQSDITGDTQSQVSVDERKTGGSDVKSYHSSLSDLEKRPNTESFTSLKADSSSTIFSTVYSGSLSTFGVPFSLPSQPRTTSSDYQWSTSSPSTMSSMSEPRSGALVVRAGDVLASDSQPRSGAHVIPDGYVLASDSQLKPASSDHLASYVYSSVPSIVRSGEAMEGHSQVRMSGSSLGFEPSGRLDVAGGIHDETMHARSSQFGKSLVDSLADIPSSQSVSSYLQPMAERESDTQEDDQSTILESSGSELPLKTQSQTDPNTTREREAASVPREVVAPAGDVDSTMEYLLQERKGEIPTENLAEFLAFTEGPVTLEDIMKVQGKGLERKPQALDKEQNITFLSTWTSTPPTPSRSHGSIHHFCTQPLSPQLPAHLQVISRKMHSRSTRAEISTNETIAIHPPTSMPHPHQKKTSADSKVCDRLHPQAGLGDGKKEVSPGSKDRLRPQASHGGNKKEVLPDVTGSKDQLHPQASLGGNKKEGSLEVAGLRMTVARDPSNLLWTPAPPKLSLHPTTIQSHLFPNYHSQERRKEKENIEKKDESIVQVPRLEALGRAYQSVPEFSRLKQYMNHRPEEKGSAKVPLQSIHEERESTTDSLQRSPMQLDSEPHSHASIPQSPYSIPQLSHQRHLSGTAKPEELTVPEYPLEAPLRPVKSLPNIPSEPKDKREKGEDFHTIMDELENQKERLVSYHKLRNQQRSEEDIHSTSIEGSQLYVDSYLTVSTSQGTFTSRRLQRQALRGGRHKGGRSRTLRRTRSALSRAQQARELISQPSRKLNRSGSFPCLSKELFDITPQHPSSDYRKSRRLSEPSCKDFRALMFSQGANPETMDPYKWAYDVWWDKWFPEVLRECREAVAELNTGRMPLGIPEKSKVQRQKEDGTQKVTKAEIVTKAPEITELENIEPLSFSDTTLIEQHEKDVKRLTKAIDVGGDPSMLAVHLCRRGALLRRLGRLRESKDDLDQAIVLEPTLSDAYWHRHMLYLVQSNEKAALEDLSTLLKHNKKHYGAYRSRANLLLKKGDTSGAVYNLSQAIALRPDNTQCYFMRAELHEKLKKIELALSDYAVVTQLDPSNVEALRRQAMHKFRQGLWTQAAQHFTSLVQLDPNDNPARLYRARALYKLGNYTQALQDLSGVIHLNPNGAEAFYQRACLLRTHQPKQALKDFSTSLLLDDSPSNIQAYIHRGILYTQMKCYDEALCDFESAIHLDRTLSPAHVCAGLIHMLQRKSPQKALKSFNSALMADPTCVRAYLCRAEAYKMAEEYQRAISDYTRAIHLHPDNPMYYIYEGELYLKLGEFEMAAMHIRTAAKLSTGFERSKTQRALVESFLGHHEEAITLLKVLPKSADTCSMMGKMHLKAQQFPSATENFRTALSIASQVATMKPRRTAPISINSDLYRSRPLTPASTYSVSAPLTPEAKSEIHFLCGQSLAQSGASKEAVDEFSKVLHYSPNHVMAYYERGVTKLKVGNSKGVLDLNKALALNPQLFQAFLTRAAYFGKCGRFSKAILNCNEATRLMPSSVRAYLYRGSLKYHTKSYNSAIEDFTTAIQLDPSHASLSYFNRAICYQATGQLEKALSDYSTVLLVQQDPDVKVLVNRGLLYLELKDHANALLDFSEAGKKVHDDPAIFQAIGFCYHQLGSLKSAVEAYSEAIQLDPSFLEAYVGRGNAFMDYLTEEGNAKSKSDYEQSLRLSPGYLPARVNLSLLLQAEGRFQLSWNELTTALETDKAYAPALEARAIVSLQMGNLFGALLDITSALKASPSAELYTNRGVIHQFTGDVMNAMRDYQVAMRLDPQYPLAHFNAGNILFQQRQFKQAISCYTEALNSSHEDDSVLVNRAIAHVMVRDTERALEDFNTAIEVNPYAAHTYFNRGNLYRSTGDFVRAEEDYKMALELQPDDWLTLYYYGEVLGKQGRLEEASEQFKKAAQIEIPN